MGVEETKMEKQTGEGRQKLYKNLAWNEVEE